MTPRSKYLSRWQTINNFLKTRLRHRRTETFLGFVIICVVLLAGDLILIYRPLITPVSDEKAFGIALLADATPTPHPSATTSATPTTQSSPEDSLLTATPPVLHYHAETSGEIEFTIIPDVRYIVFENAGDANCIASGAPAMAPTTPPWTDMTTELPKQGPNAKSQRDADTFHPEDYSVVSLEVLQNPSERASRIRCTFSRASPFRDSFDARSLIFQHIALTQQTIGEYRLENTRALDDFNLDLGRISPDVGSLVLEGGSPPTDSELPLAAGRNLAKDATLSASWHETSESNLRDVLTFIAGALLPLILSLFIEMYKSWLDD